MFKAALIENEGYYRLRSKQLFLMLLPSLLIGFIVNLVQIPAWLTIAMMSMYILVVFLLVRNQEKMNSILGKRLIEMDDKQIRIKSKKGRVQEIFELSMVEKILVKETYLKPQETIKEVGKEIVGVTQRNYLQIQHDGQDTRLDFEIDSHYMIVQLNKTLEAWRISGYNISILS